MFVNFFVDSILALIPMMHETFAEPGKPSGVLPLVCVQLYSLNFALNPVGLAGSKFGRIRNFFADILLLSKQKLAKSDVKQYIE